MPTAVELLQWIGMSWKIVACLQFRNNAPNLASVADAATNLRIAHNVKNAPFNLMGCVGLNSYPKKKCPHALLWVFALDR